MFQFHRRDTVYFICLFVQFSIETTDRVYNSYTQFLCNTLTKLSTANVECWVSFSPKEAGRLIPFWRKRKCSGVLMRGSRCTWTFCSCRYRQAFVFSDWSLITFIMNSLNQQYEEKVRPCIDLIDSLRSLGVEKDLALPAIAVIGDQSSGKSSVLEALSGVALPRGSGRCSQEI